MKKSTLIILKLGGFQTLAMAIYHFFIPFQFEWSNYISDYSPTINWSLFSINNYFSFNLLLLGLSILYFLKKRSSEICTIKLLTIMNLLFWLFSLLYQIVDPMPLPESLMWLSFLLPGIAFINSSIFGIGYVQIVRKTKAS